MKPLKTFCKRYIQYKLKFHDNDVNSLVFNSRTLYFSHEYENAENLVYTSSSELSEGEYNDWVVIEGLLPLSKKIRPEIQVFFELKYDDEKDEFMYVKMESWPEPVKKYYEKHHIVPIITDIG